LIIRRATASDARVVAEVLHEAAAHADSLGNVLWQLDELTPARLADEIARGMFFVAWSVTGAGDESAGVVRFQLDDDEFWPDDPGANAAYIHRLGVRAKYRGGGVAQRLMSWAVDEGRRLGREVLRLDTDADRPRLRAVYERFGFRLHSYRQVGPYYVARYEYRLS
jgi:GNAT superfamily N-acetyltransferase